MSANEPTITYARLIDQLKSAKEDAHRSAKRYMRGGPQNFHLSYGESALEDWLEERIRALEQQRARLLEEQARLEEQKQLIDDVRGGKKVRSIRSPKPEAS